MNPIVDGLEEQFDEEIEFLRLEVGSGRGRSAARDYGIIGQPTFIFIDSAGEEVRRLMGPQNPTVMEFEIERLIEE